VAYMDVTQIKSKEGIVHYLHLLIDNYSRKILSWHMDTRLRAKNSLFVTKKAIRQMADKKKSAILITDGGSEFDNVLMRTALAGTGLELKIAGKDVEFSNSMIEAVNKSLKYTGISFLGNYRRRVVSWNISSVISKSIMTGRIQNLKVLLRMKFILAMSLMNRCTGFYLQMPGKNGWL
jgi:transposase InsO family protein